MLPLCSCADVKVVGCGRAKMQRGWEREDEGDGPRDPCGCGGDTGNGGGGGGEEVVVMLVLR